MTVTADLASLRAMIGAISDNDDELLQSSLDQANAWAEDHLYPERIPRDDVQGGILLLASRIFQRRRSPEGVAGFSEFGAVRVLVTDPDIARQFEFSVDLTKAGVA